jgi:large subunit ribosomal protein L1
MKLASKRFRKASEVSGLKIGLPLEKAVSVLKGFPTAKFDETVELSVRLNVDPRQSSQMVRGTVSLPHGSGKTVRVIVFTEKPEEALAAGADEAGLADLIKKVQEGWMDFDVAIATTSAMKEVRSVARVLGPRGLMPNPKSGTVTDDVAEGINAVKAGRVEYKMDKTANTAIVVGKLSFTEQQLIENTQVAIDTLGKAKPEAVRGRFIKSLTLSSTMSPGVRLEADLFAKF